MADTQLPVPEENGGTKKKKKKKKKKERGERDEPVSDDESITTTSEKSPETSLQNGVGGEDDEKRKKKKKSKKKTSSDSKASSPATTSSPTTTEGDSSSTSQLPSPEEQPRYNNDDDVKPLYTELAVHTGGKGIPVTNNNKQQHVTCVEGEGKSTVTTSTCEQGLSSSSSSENTGSTEDRIKTLLSEMAAIRSNTERISTGMVSSLTVCEASSTRTRELRKPSSQALGLLDQVEAAQRQARMLKSRVDGVIRRNRVSDDKLKEIQVIQSKREEEEEEEDSK